MEIVVDETIKDRIPKYIEASTVGNAADGSRMGFKLEVMYDEQTLKSLKERNTDVKTYVWRKPSSNIGLMLAVETSITASRETDPIRIWVREILYEK